MQNFISLWQNLPQHIDPVAIPVGGFEVRWYGLMYLAAFLCTYLLLRYSIRAEQRFQKYSKDFVIDLCLWLIVGLLIGARLGYALFYNFGYFLEHPLQIILPFRNVSGEIVFTGLSGMSFHGGVIGVLIAGLLFIKFKKADFWNLADLLCPAIPLGYTFGRIGNFLNGELWGRATDSGIGMYFPQSPDYYGAIASRHPSQLYEAFFEGIVLFVILWSLRGLASKHLPKGIMLPLFLIGYGIFRFFIEYFREPDSHIGLLALNLSMGQILCIGMIALGLVLIPFLNGKNKQTEK